VRDVERQNMLVIIVDVRADKGEIKAAVQDILGVKVKKVNTLIRSASASLVIPSSVLLTKSSKLVNNSVL
jgi:ribosomal protein L23